MSAKPARNQPPLFSNPPVLRFGPSARVAPQPAQPAPRAVPETAQPADAFSVIEDLLATNPALTGRDLQLAFLCLKFIQLASRQRKEQPSTILQTIAQHIAREVYTYWLEQQPLTEEKTE